MEMRLTSEAFGAAFKDLSVKDVNIQCSQLEGSKDICENTDNWRAYVMYKYGRKYLVERSDLVTTEDWIDFCRGMEKGYVFRYTIGIGENSEVGSILDGYGYWREDIVLNAELNELESHYQNIKLKLLGTFLRPGPFIHYYCHIYIRGETLFPDAAPVDILDFSWSPNRIFISPTICAEYSIEYLNAKLFHNPQILQQLKATEIDIEISSSAYVHEEDDIFVKAIGNNGEIFGIIKELADPNLSSDSYGKAVQIQIFFEGLAEFLVEIVWYPAIKIEED